MVDGVGRDLRDDEVEQPLRRGAHPDAVAAEPVGEDLAQVDPWDRAPGRGVADDVEVNLCEQCQRMRIGRREKRGGLTITTIAIEAGET